MTQPFQHQHLSYRIPLGMEMCGTPPHPHPCCKHSLMPKQILESGGDEDTVLCLLMVCVGDVPWADGSSNLQTRNLEGDRPALVDLSRPATCHTCCSMPRENRATHSQPERGFRGLTVPRWTPKNSKGQTNCTCP